MTRKRTDQRSDKLRPVIVRGRPDGIAIAAVYFVGLFAATLGLLILDTPDWPLNALVLLALLPFGWIAWRLVSLLRAALGTALRVDAQGIFRAGVTERAIPWGSVAGEPEIRKVGLVRTIVIPVRSDDPHVRMKARLEKGLRPASDWLNGGPIIDLITVSLERDVEKLHAQIMAWYLDKASVF